MATSSETPVAEAGAVPRVLVLFGGQSAEHDVSCVTAKHVLAAIREDRYDIVPVGIDRNGGWNAVAVDLSCEALDPSGDPVDPFSLMVETARAGGTCHPATSN